MKHALSQIEYLGHKAEIVRRMFGGRRNRITHHETRLHGKSYKQVLFSKSHRYFRTLHRVMYPGGKKTITKQVLDYLNPQGLALWYMDDGNKNVNRANDGRITSCTTIIATCCPREQAEVVQRWFLERHGIAVKLSQTHPGQWSIRMNTEASRKFVAVVKPYIVPSMQYKISHVSDLNSHERLPVPVACCDCGGDVFDDRRGGRCTNCYYRFRKDSPTLLGNEETIRV